MLSRLSVAVAALVGTGLWGTLSCGDSTVPSPFVAADGGIEADADAAPESDAAAADVAGDADPFLGGPCVDDEQCDDGVECTQDECDETIERCRFVPDASVCDNGSFCDGVEQCHPKLGCRAGPPISCSDDNTCTIDSCVEVSKSCAHSPRDADGDGDPDWNCPPGGDCNETDPAISSLAAEVCANGRDDDCDTEIDEAECESPEHDTCIDPLEIDASGTYTMKTVATKSDYSATCAGTGGAWRDVVAALVVPPGGPVDIEVLAVSTSGNMALAAATLCGDPASEIGCAESFPKPAGGEVARLRLREVPPGTYPLYVFTDTTLPITLTVTYLPPSTAATNETCGTAAPLAVGAHETVQLIDASADVASNCTTSLGELVYRFELTASRDVEVFATSLDGLGTPAISLRRAPCVDPETEITCQTSSGVALFARALPAGTYFVAVSATSPTDVDLVVETSPPSIPPLDESCDGAPPIAPGQTLLVGLENHADDATLACLPGARDAAYSLELTEASDVLLIERISSGDTGAVSLATPPCTDASDALACGTSTRSPVRAAAHGVPPGSYRAVVESANVAPVTLSALTRPAQPPIFVAFADTCSDAVSIPPTGGFFQGNTANATADYEVGCDLGGQPAGGGRDQMLRLTLAETRRVVFDMAGSAYQTLLQVRAGPTCPGADLVQACAAGFFAERSFLDLTLAPGDYFVTVDGYNGDSGAWQLNVFVD